LLTGYAVISSSLNVKRRQVFTESLRRILAEQMACHLLGKELVTCLRTVASQTPQYHVNSRPRLLIQQTWIEELLSTDINVTVAKKVSKYILHEFFMRIKINIIETLFSKQMVITIIIATLQSVTEKFCSLSLGRNQKIVQNRHRLFLPKVYIMSRPNCIEKRIVGLLSLTN